MVSSNCKIPSRILYDKKLKKYVSSGWSANQAYILYPNKFATGVNEAEIKDLSCF